jgi:hypothetical protein
MKSLPVTVLHNSFLITFSEWLSTENGITVPIESWNDCRLEYEFNWCNRNIVNDTVEISITFKILYGSYDAPFYQLTTFLIVENKLQKPIEDVLGSVIEYITNKIDSDIQRENNKDVHGESFKMPEVVYKKEEWKQQFINQKVQFQFATKEKLDNYIQKTKIAGTIIPSNNYLIATVSDPQFIFAVKGFAAEFTFLTD